MSKGRKIIITQSVVISGMVTEVISRVVFPDVTGWRFVVLFAAVFLMLFRTLDDITAMVLKGARNDKAARAESNRGTVPGIPWNKMRFQRTEQADRDTESDLVQIS